MTNPRPSVVCVLTLPHRPHMWITPGIDHDCPGWTDEHGNAPDYWDACLADKRRRRAEPGETR